MKLYLPITVDLYNIYPLRVLNLQQNNVGRGALITLTAAGAVIVPDSESLYVYAQKQDGTVVYNTCTLKDNQIQVDFDEQMTVESGILQVELQMVDTSGNSITTPIFQVNVQKSNIDYQKITSQDSFQALITTLAEVQELKKNGLKGDPGEAATIQIGTVTASDPGSGPEVTNSGTKQDAVLNFVLPRGIQGPTGPKGDPGTANAATVAYDNSTSGAEETNAQDAFDKLYGDIASLTEKTTMSWYGTGDDAVLTTKVWSQADDGFSYDVPTTGWYYLCARFTKNTSSSDYTGDMQLQLKSRTNGSLASTTIIKLNSMSVYEVSKIARLVKGDKIFANVHTAQAGIKFNTGLFAVLLRTI